MEGWTPEQKKAAAMLPTITAHWRNKNWEYIPASTHNNSAEFRARMEKRRKEVQERKPSTTENT